SSRGGNRTHNHPVNNRPLYRLSYPEISAPGGTRTHTPRFKRPLLNPLSFEGVQCGGTELNRRLRVGMASGCRYPTAAKTPIGSEGVEPSPQRLKGAYAAVTPR